MDPKTLHAIGLIAVIAVVTALLRCLPFLIFGGKKTSPAVVVYLGRVLPFAVMGMLVIYCYKDVSLLRYPYALPEVIAGLIVALLHLWRRNTLLSIVVGTASYMLLVQLVFV